MLLVQDGREAGYRHGACAAGVELVLPFVAHAAWARVDFVGEGGVGAVEFVGVDAAMATCLDLKLVNWGIVG